MLLLCSISCNKNRKNPGHIYYPEMIYSKAYETYDENPNYTKKAFLLPVEGTVSRSMIPYQYSKTDSERILAGKEYINLIDTDSLSIKKGNKLYELYCLQCHGDKANGNGPLYMSGRYPYRPASLNTINIQNIPDGEIYHVITVGYGIMGAHGSQIKPEDRWNIINFIKISF